MAGKLRSNFVLRCSEMVVYLYIYIYLSTFILEYKKSIELVQDGGNETIQNADVVDEIFDLFNNAYE